MPKHEPPPGIEIVRVPDPQVEAQKPTRLEEWIDEAAGQAFRLVGALPRVGDMADRFARDVAPHCPIDLPGGWRFVAEAEPGKYYPVLFGSATGARVYLRPPASVLEEAADA